MLQLRIGKRFVIYDELRTREIAVPGDDPVDGERRAGRSFRLLDTKNPCRGRRPCRGCVTARALRFALALVRSQAFEDGADLAGERRVLRLQRQILPELSLRSFQIAPFEQGNTGVEPGYRVVRIAVENTSALS